MPVANGIYDTQTRELLPFSPTYPIISKIATAYNADAKQPSYFSVRDWFMSIACDDKDVVRLLLQIVADAINPNYSRHAIVFLVGSGDNGKGTYLEMLRNLIGSGNYSALLPGDYADRFRSYELIGKACNIGDDVPAEYLANVSKMKSIATADAITVEKKYGGTRSVKLGLLSIFSANSMPKVNDKTRGFLRRLCLVPFDADFNGGKENRAIRDDYMQRPETLEYILKIALELPAFEHFTQPHRVRDAIADYEVQNDFIKAFVKDVFLENGLQHYVAIPCTWIGAAIKEYLYSLGNKAALPRTWHADFMDALDRQAGLHYRESRQRIEVAELNAIESSLPGCHDERMKIWHKEQNPLRVFMQA